MSTNKKIFITLLVLLITLLLQTTVNATQINTGNLVQKKEIFTKMEIKFTDPKAGDVIPAYAKVTLSNDINKIVYDDIELTWKKLDSEGNWNFLNQDEVKAKAISFENNFKYTFEIPDVSWDMIESEDYELSRDADQYVNGILVEDGNISRDIEFYIGGVQSIEILVNNPIVGNTFPTTAKYIFKTATGTREFLIDINEWIEITENGLENLDSNAVAESGKKYSFSPKVNEELNLYLTATDIRTKLFINGVENNYILAIDNNITFTISNNIKNTTLSNSATSVAPNTEYKTTILENDGYKLPDMVYILIGESELSTSSYTYNKETGELIIPAERVTGNITIVGNIVKEYPSGTAKTEIKDNEITWVKEDSNGQSFWFGIDNSEKIFTSGSTFWVKTINKDIDQDEWLEYSKKIDETTKTKIDNDKLLIFLVGVTNPNAEEYRVLDKSVKLHIQYPDNWSKEDMKAIFISDSRDENITFEIKELNYPEGKSNFAVLTLNHFSPYAIYEEKTEVVKEEIKEEEKQEIKEETKEEIEEEAKEDVKPEIKEEIKDTNNEENVKDESPQMGNSLENKISYIGISILILASIGFIIKRKLKK